MTNVVTIVDDNEGLLVIRSLGMRVHLTGGTVSSPAGVGDAHVHGSLPIEVESVFPCNQSQDSDGRTRVDGPVNPNLEFKFYLH